MHARAHIHTRRMYASITSELSFSDITEIVRGVLYNFQDYNLFAASGVFFRFVDFAPRRLCFWRSDFSVFRTFRSREIPRRALRWANRTVSISVLRRVERIRGERWPQSRLGRFQSSRSEPLIKTIVGAPTGSEWVYIPVDSDVSRWANYLVNEIKLEWIKGRAVVRMQCYSARWWVRASGGKR